MMHKYRSFLFLLAFLGGFTIGVSADSATKAVATTPWTAAFAQAAGLGSVHVLAPYDLRHPAEYELRPGDVLAVREADILIYAGYERMMERLAGTGQASDQKRIQIATSYDMQTLEKSLMAIARAAGTVGQATAEVEKIRTFYAAWRAELKREGLYGAPVLVHFHQQPLARELGFEIAGVFGPGPLEAQQIVKLSRQHAALCIDNWHNEVAAPLKETMPAVTFVSFINFPGKDGTRSIMDVLRYNRNVLKQATE